VNTGTGSGPVSIAAGGTLAGSFTISGATTVDGALSPGGASVGAANFGNNLTFGTTAVTNLNLASASSFDTINVAGTLTLDGTLAVTTTGGYVVQFGAQFHVIGWSILVSSGFNPATDIDFSCAATAPNVYWNTTNFLTTGTLVAIPEPSEWGVILGAAFGGLVLLRRRKLSQK
jgi:hypothetical protein